MARRTTKRAPLTRERVLHAALALADAHGVEALSMRRLAQELGVEAMSLYNHVANKDDLLAGVVDLVANEIELPPEDADWKSALRHAAVSAHDTLARHRWVRGLWMSPRQAGTTRMEYSDAILRTLREGGFSDDLTYHAFHILQSHVIGFTLYESSFPSDRRSVEKMATRFLRDFPADDYPDLAEHIRQHTAPSDGQRSTFEFALDLILDGLERLKDERSRRRSR
jgi:AcrR family transcriptional regulator